LLQAQNLKVYYRTQSDPVRAVDGVSFAVKAKEIVGLAGESGCGKSTLAVGLLKLVSPPAYIEGGKVLYRGKDLFTMNNEELRKIRWKHIALLPQSAMNALNPVMKVHDQIKDAMEAHDGKDLGEDLGDHITTLLKSVALSSRVSRAHATELSGGMRQRAIISMAMALKPELIIADEPTSALDVVVQRGVLELLVDLKDKSGSSLLLVSHDIAILSEVVDRLAIMYAGKMVEIQDVYDIFDDPLHPYTRGLIASVPSLEKGGIPRSIPGLPPDLKRPPPGCRFHPRCPNASAICTKEDPILKEIEPGKFVACHASA